LRSKYGYWHREGQEFIHINAVQPNGVLYGVTRYRYDEQNRLTEALFVERAIFQRSYWFTDGVGGSRIRGNGTESQASVSSIWETSLTRQVLAMVILKPEHLALGKLMIYAEYMAKQGLEADEYWLAFWQKLLQPLATLGLVLIATSFVFGPLREVTMGLRMTAGIATGLFFHYGQQFFGHMSLVFDSSPFLAASVPAFISLFVGVLMLLRAR